MKITSVILSIASGDSELPFLKAWQVPSGLPKLANSILEIWLAPWHVKFNVFHRDGLEANLTWITTSFFEQYQCVLFTSMDILSRDMIHVDMEIDRWYN